MQKLDQRSRHTIRRAMAAASLVIGCILLIAALRNYRLNTVIHDVSVGFTAAAITAMAAALLRHERAGRGSLNGWDESLAFNGLALLVRVLHHAR